MLGQPFRQRFLGKMRLRKRLRDSVFDFLFLQRCEERQGQGQQCKPEDRFAVLRKDVLFPDQKLCRLQRNDRILRLEQGGKQEDRPLIGGKDNGARRTPRAFSRSETGKQENKACGASHEAV